MEGHRRVTVDIDGTEISALEAHYVVNRSSNQHGQRIGGTMQARAWFIAEIRNEAGNPPDNVIKLWNIATESTDPLHDVTITFYKNDVDVLNVAKFRGWISTFEAYRPALGAGPGGGESANLLHCEIAVVLDSQTTSKHKFTK